MPERMYLAVDDTDSLQGMCTTHLAFRLAASLGADLIGHPRLVRLNPAVPWKTRGNGAVCMRLGIGGGSRETVGRFQGRRIDCFSRLRGEVDADLLLEEASRAVERWSSEGEDTNPGLVVSERKPPQSLYWKGVRTIVEREEVMSWVRDQALHRAWGNGRGIIGSVCGMAWRPRDRTYELLAYRKEDRWGSERLVDPDSVRRMDSEVPSTFNNHDPRGGGAAIVPSSPCPVLYGIRGDDPGELEVAMGMLRSEEGDGWLTYLTNQGTDDHLMRGSPRPFSSYVMEGTVAAPPRTKEGGHVILPLSTPHGEIDCAAYEPSKGFRKAVLQLRPGDRLEACGEMRDLPRTLNLEKMRVIHVARRWRKVANPRCPDCGGRMASAGFGAGYRCRGCGTRASEEAAVMEEETRWIVPGWYEPPVCSRRHLSKPLKRMGEQQPLSFV